MTPHDSALDEQGAAIIRKDFDPGISAFCAGKCSFLLFTALTTVIPAERVSARAGIHTPQWW
jgi:hypothetical protein